MRCDINNTFSYASKNLLVIHKEKQKKLMFNECLISDKDTARLYIHFFTPR